MFPSETEAISSSTQTSLESVSKHHKSHSYLLRHVFLPSVLVSRKNKFLKIANTTSKITGLPVPSLAEITDRAVLREARSVSADPSHPLYDEFELLPSARRFRAMKCVKNRFR